MPLFQRISAHFDEHQLTVQAAAESLAQPLATAIERLTHCLFSNRRILVCGLGASHDDAVLLVRSLCDRFELDRPPLAGLLLAAPAGADALYVIKQLQALAHPGDTLVLLTGDYDDEALACALVDTAHSLDMGVIALTRPDDADLAARLGAADLELQLPAQRAARAHELRRLLVHCLCDGVDCLLLGVESHEA